MDSGIRLIAWGIASLALCVWEPDARASVAIGVLGIVLLASGWRKWLNDSTPWEGE